MLSAEAKRQLVWLRKRTGHVSLLTTLEWCIRAMADHYERNDRANAAGGGAT